MVVTNADIMEKLGGLAEAVKGLQTSNTEASAGRRGMYEALEAQSRVIQNIQFEAEKHSGIVSQVRDEVKGLHMAQTAMGTDIKPLLDLKDELPAMVEVWKDMNKWSKRLVWVLGLGGVGTLTAFVWFGNQVVDGIRHVLRIP